MFFYSQFFYKRKEKSILHITETLLIGIKWFSSTLPVTFNVSNCKVNKNISNLAVLSGSKRCQIYSLPYKFKEYCSFWTKLLIKIILGKYAALLIKKMYSQQVKNKIIILCSTKQHFMYTPSVRRH